MGLSDQGCLKYRECAVHNGVLVGDDGTRFRLVYLKDIARNIKVWTRYQAGDVIYREGAPQNLAEFTYLANTLDDQQPRLKVGVTDMGFIVDDPHPVEAKEPEPDAKIKSAAKKVPLNLIPLRALKGMARVFGYGVKKYKQGNFLKATMSDGAGDRYPGAKLRHLAEMQELDGSFSLERLAKRDEESDLPEIDHILAGLTMLRAIMIKDGLLPEDPGEGKEPPK